MKQAYLLNYAFLSIFSILKTDIIHIGEWLKRRGKILLIFYINVVQCIEKNLNSLIIYWGGFKI